MPESKLADQQAARIEILKLRLERARYRSEIIKWIAIALGAIISFVVIDFGKLKLEQFRVASDRQIRFIEAYSKATEAAEPEIWKRKLHVLRLFATDDDVRIWVKDQLAYIDDYAALDALYRETLKTASQLVEPLTQKEPERTNARRRLEQLYWADLPFAGEPPEVGKAMVQFRNALVSSEKQAAEGKEWGDLNLPLITLSQTLRAASRKASLPNEARANP